jgi:primary-amine oxidase
MTHTLPPFPFPPFLPPFLSDLVEGGFRTDAPKLLNITQPDGPSFTVEGNKVSWQQWSFRVGFNFREGLVLHQVGYEDQGRVRPIVFRASMVEMAVPYAEPRAPYHRKCAFDVSDYGLGELDERGGEREGGRGGRERARG